MHEHERMVVRVVARQAFAQESDLGRIEVSSANGQMLTGVAVLRHPGTADQHESGSSDIERLLGSPVALDVDVSGLQIVDIVIAGHPENGHSDSRQTVVDRIPLARHSLPVGVVEVCIAPDDVAGEHHEIRRGLGHLGHQLLQLIVESAVSQAPHMPENREAERLLDIRHRLLGMSRLTCMAQRDEERQRRGATSETGHPGAHPLPAGPGIA